MPDQAEEDQASPQARLARAAIESFVREGRRLKPEERPAEAGALQEQAGAFVSLKKGNKLRGCIGTFKPTRSNLAEEIIANAISAATRDPRFPPLTEGELDELNISVDVLGDPEPVPDPSYLDPRKYGVIVQRGTRTGLLLPDLEGVDGVEEQIDIARSKAGIEPGEPVQLYRFTVTRYH